MVSDESYMRALLLHYFKKRLSAAAAVKEICAVEGEDAVKDDKARFWFRRFKLGDTDLEDKPRSGRPSVIDQETLRAATEESPGSSVCSLANELNIGKSSVHRHLIQLGFENKRPRIIPHELKPAQAQKRVNICRQLLQNPQDMSF